MKPPKILKRHKKSSGKKIKADFFFDKNFGDKNNVEQTKFLLENKVRRTCWRSIKWKIAILCCSTQSRKGIGF